MKLPSGRVINIDTVTIFYIGTVDNSVSSETETSSRFSIVYYTKINEHRQELILEYTEESEAETDHNFLCTFA